MKRIFIFVYLVVFCIALSSLNLNQSTYKKYVEFQSLEQEGHLDLAKSGFLTLAMKYPYTVAGIKAARQLVENGASPVRLVFEIAANGIRNTTAAEWLILISAFFVVTVFIGANGMSPIFLVPFVISGAGLFHQSHALVSIHSDVFEAFLNINPYFYIALTLLITGGYLHRKWEVSGQVAYRRAFVGDTLAFGDLLLAKGRYSEKLKEIQGRVELLIDDLQSAQGQHVVKEIKRLSETMEKELNTIKQGLVSAEVQHQDMIAVEEEAIVQARHELLEKKISFKSKGLGRREYKRRRLEKESIIQKSRKRISNINARLGKIDKTHLGNRLQFMRRDLFLTFLHTSFIDKKDGFGDIDLRATVFPLKTAKLDIKRRRILYRKSLAVGRKIVRLEQRQGEIGEAVYRAKIEPLMKEKQIIDKALIEVADKISGQIVSCRKQHESLEDLIQTLTVESEDMKTLRRIRNCFPSHVRSRIQKSRQSIKLCKKTLNALRRVEKIYNNTSHPSSNGAGSKDKDSLPLSPVVALTAPHSEKKLWGPAYKGWSEISDKA